MSLDLRPDVTVRAHGEGTVHAAPPDDVDQHCINTIRTFAMDAVQQANSGHPGTPMALAALAYVLWTRYPKHNPGDPAWPERDRFVLSGEAPRSVERASRPSRAARTSWAEERAVGRRPT